MFHKCDITNPVHQTLESARIIRVLSCCVTFVFAQSAQVVGILVVGIVGTSTQIFTIANLKVPVLYMVALSELKLNENLKYDEVVMYQSMLHACILSHFRWYPEIFFSHLSPIFCIKSLGQLREIPSVSFFRINI